MPSFYAGSNFYVKEIKGKHYVYVIENDEQRRHRYIGPLDKIIEFYLSNGGVGDTPTVRPPGFEPGITGLEGRPGGDNAPKTLVKLKGVRTTDEGVRDSNSLVISASDLAKFEMALRQKNISEDTIKQYLSCIKKNKKDSNNCIKAWRNFYKLVLGREPPKDLKPKKTKVDLRVPSLEEIKKTLEAVKGRSELFLFYRLLLESGAREKEVLKILNEYDPQNEMKEDGFFIYALNWQRGSKKSFYIFHVTPIIKMRITKAMVDKAVKKYNLVPPKYFRKFVATKLVELGVSTEIVDFIQGRTPSSILTKHYLDLLTLAKKEYRKYAEWLTSNNLSV